MKTKTILSLALSLTFLMNVHAESDLLKYFVNIPGGSNLGDGTSGTVKFTITGTGGQDFKWIAISVLRGQYFKPGNYSDSLTMTLTY